MTYTRYPETLKLDYKIIFLTLSLPTADNE